MQDTYPGVWRPPFEGIWEIWPPKCCRSSCRSPKGTSLHDDVSFKPFWVKIHQRLTSVGEPEKKYIKTFWCYISRIRPDVPLEPIDTIWGLHVRLVDVINCAKFYRNRLRGVGFCEGSKFDHSHWIALSPLTQGGRSSAYDQRYLDTFQSNKDNAIAIAYDVRTRLYIYIYTSRRDVLEQAGIGRVVEDRRWPTNWPAQSWWTFVCSACSTARSLQSVTRTTTVLLTRPDHCIHNLMS